MKIRGQRMLEAMEIKHVSRKQLAIMLGISTSQLCNVLKGRRRFDLKQSKLLIEFFGTDLMSQIIDWSAMGVKSPLTEA